MGKKNLVKVRKLGHITILLDENTINNISEIIKKIEDIWYN